MAFYKGHSDNSEEGSLKGSDYIEQEAIAAKWKKNRSDCGKRKERTKIGLEILGRSTQSDSRSLYIHYAFITLHLHNYLISFLCTFFCHNT